MELESILLLKNENSALPLSENDTVTLLGNGVIHTNTGGGGSGGGMGAFSISFLDAMDEKKLPYTATPTDYYRQKYAEGKGAFDSVHGWDDSDEELWGAQQFSNSGWNNAAPIAVPELKLSDEMMDTAAAGARTAIVFISRTVGCEEMDRGIPRPSDWYLNPSEEQLINQAVTRFDKVILVINSSGSIDFSWMERLDPEKKISAIVLSYGAGSYYGDVLADLLYGKENFSAKLPDTITRTIEAHHTFRNFGGQQSYAHNGAKPGFADNGRRFMTRNGENDPVGIYQEYVYMGYRYFDTFRGSSDDVLFPFGYGLSYSTFCYKDASVSRKGDTITVEVTVENTSSVPGKAVAEVYISNPNDGKLDQPYQRLMTFAKTKVLSGGESQRVSASFTVHHMSSYSEELAAYVLEPGKHLIRLGDSSRSTSVCGAIEVEELIVVEQLKNRLTLDNCNPDGDKSNQKEFDGLRLNSQRESDTIGNAERDAEQLVGKTVLTLKQSDVDTVYTLGELPVYVPGQAPEDHTATLQAVVNGELSLSDYVAQLTDFELACIMAGGAGIGNVITCPDDPGVALTAEKSKPSEPNSYSTGAGTSRSNSRIGFPSLSY